MTAKIILVLTFFILNFCNKVTAQTSKDSALYQIILKQDSLLFNVGFNTCDISQFQKLLSENLRFYHDKDGISDKNKFLFDIKNGLCKNPENRQVKRFLIKGSTQVFPLYKNGILYGAIQNGEHTFAENPQNPSGIAKFTHVWQLENGEWKLTTSLSYDHQPYQNTAKQNSIFDNEAEIKNWLKENKVPALGIGIIEDGKLQDVKVFWEISKGNAAPYNTIFNVASLTKPITAIVALKLISQGKWSLDETLDKYWVDPDIANNSWHKKITTRLILSHQTGFPNWRGNNENGKLNFNFEPGTKYQYSGEGLEYLRKALEKKFKKSLQELATELVFQPLKMEDTSYIWSENIDSKRIAIGYNKEEKPYDFLKKTTPNAADDLLTTIEDYGKFLVSVLNKEGLSDEVFNEMVTNQVESSRGKYFGLGFEIYNFENGDYALSHGGSDEGVRTLVFIFPKTKKGLLIFTNSDSGGNLYEEIVKHYLGENGQRIIDIETK